MKTAYSKSAAGELLEWHIDSFGGLDYNTDSSQIADGRSPDMQNLIIDAHGGLVKRNGWRKLLPQALPGGPVGLIIYYPKLDKLVFAAGRNIYAFREGAEPVSIGTLDAPPTAAFVMNDCLWLLDGSTYWCYNGQNLTHAQATAYVPLIYQDVEGLLTPDKKAEDYNLLSLSFRIQYSPDGTRKRFWLPQWLDYRYVQRISLNGEVWNVNYTLNIHPHNPYVEFNTAPEAGINTLEIQVLLQEGSASDKRALINRCRICGVFGGDNDTRIFLSGNPAKPSTDWHSGLYDPTYFPEQQYSQIGWSDDAIVGYSLHYDTMVIHKQHSTWSRSFAVEEGSGIFPVKPVNEQVGLLAKSSLQIIDNSPAVLTENGVFLLSGSQVRDERNMKHISAMVDKRLLREENLATAVSFDFGGRYGLIIGGRAYVYDYRNGEWLYWHNIPANCCYSHGGKLYFGSADEGMLCRFSLDGEDGVWSDDGQPIAAYWQSKSCDLGSSTASKLLRRIYLTLPVKAAKNSVEVRYSTERQPSASLRRCYWRLFSFADVDFNNFSFIINKLPQVFVRKAQARRFLYLSLHLANDKPGEGLAVSRLAVAYQLDKQVVR